MVLSKEELGKLIKSARKLKAHKIEKKYTQEMLAEDIGISRSYLGDIEAGRTYPNYVLLNRIAEACGVPFSYFDGPELYFTKDLLGKIRALPYENIEDDQKLHSILQELLLLVGEEDLAVIKVMPQTEYIRSEIKRNIALRNTLILSAKYIPLLKIFKPDLVKSLKEEDNENKKKYEKNMDNDIDVSDILNEDMVNEEKVPYKITDVKEAVEIILSQPGLMLNGEMLTNESKIALANAINMGLAYAEQIQEKEKKGTKEK